MDYKQLVVVGLVVVIAAGCSGNKDKYEAMIAEKDSQIATLEDELNTLEGDLAEEADRAAQLNGELESALSEYQEQEKVWLEMKDSKTIITVSDAVLFPSGRADMVEEGKAIIDQIARVAANHPDRAILVEGHSDNVPIGAMIKEKYYSNWELSSSRACSVLRYMYWESKLDPTQLSAIGYGEHRPIADNDTVEGRGRNRRVVIVIGPKE
jgi:chemotaxis protein MotB